MKYSFLLIRLRAKPMNKKKLEEESNRGKALLLLAGIAAVSCIIGGVFTDLHFVATGNSFYAIATVTAFLFFMAILFGGGEE